MNNYAPNFILYEISSPFLNAHWCFDKLNMTGSRAQLINGLVLLATFFCSRLVWGPWQSFLVTRDAIRAYFYLRSKPMALESIALQHANSTLTDMSFAWSSGAEVPAWLVLVYAASNVVLNTLNFYWFSKMITAIRKRFTGEKQDKHEKRKEQDELIADGATASGTSSKGGRRRRG